MGPKPFWQRVQGAEAQDSYLQKRRVTSAEACCFDKQQAALILHYEVFTVWGKSQRRPHALTALPVGQGAQF